ncbi:MAG: DUF2520 domain-containing protein [Bacteroidia bacterium]|nr:DUF2520 domain-containing protein [Bacteroidia bacterium]
MRITLIGAGRLAWSLIPNLQQKGMEIYQLISRNPEKTELFRFTYGIHHTANSISELFTDTDVVILTVNDAEIESVASQLPDSVTVLHTSGSISASVLGKKNSGVLYPLQIFTYDNVVDFRDTPVFYEGQENGLKVARLLAETLSQRTLLADSTQRLSIHIGAVFACNFSNVLYQIAAKLLPEGSNFQVYQPLIEEQIRKAFRYQPHNSQTGPAVRKDFPTLEKHLEILETHPQWQEIYRLLSREINPALSDFLRDSKK